MNQAIVSGVAGRYATALFELALEQKALDAVATDLAGFEALLDKNPDLDRLVTSPVFSADEQAGALEPILKQARIGALAAKFLLMVAKKRRLIAIRHILKAFRTLVASHKGEATAEVTVAEPLAEKHLAALKEALKAATKKEVAIDLRVDPALIGGLVVRIGSRMIDASLKTKLNAMRIAMKEAR